MPSTPRPPGAPSSSVALELDIEALRYLVSRPTLASALWNRPARETAQTALRGEYGNSAVLAHKVTRQALSTAVSAIRDAFDARPEHTDAKHVLDMLTLILGLGADLDFKLQRTLMTAAVHAALLRLPTVDRAAVKGEYRSLLNIVRDAAWTSVPAVSSMKDIAVDTIKAVVRAIHNLEEDASLLDVIYAVRAEAVDFHNRFPVAKLGKQLHEHANRLQAGLAPLWVLDKYHQEARKARRSGLADLRRAEPDFFSDVEEVHGAGTQSDQWRHALIKVEPTRYFSSPMRTDESEEAPEESVLNDDDRTESAAAEEAPTKPPSKRRRRSSHDRLSEERSSRDAPADEVDDDDFSDMKLRPRKTPRGVYKEWDSLDSVPSEDESRMKGVQSMDTSSFSGSQKEDVDQIARHSRAQHPGKNGKHGSRIQSKSPRVMDKKTSNGLHQRSSSGGELSDENKTDSDRDEIERSRVAGQGGEALRGLHDAATQLKEGGIPDPLHASVRDAKGAKHRARRSLLMRYSPDANARPASPIPGSEVPIQRKRGDRVELPTEDSSAEKRRVPREALFHGRILRSGRFQIYEDDLLVEGLVQYGWGMWTAIAKNFGTGRYTRAPMSLKDRARTMGLDPAKYPMPANSSVVKKGRPSLRPQLRTERSSTANGENIESPGVSIEKDAA